MLTKIAYGWLILALDSVLFFGSFLLHMQENDFWRFYSLFGQKLGMTLMLSLILFGDKNEDFKKHRLHIAIHHVALTIIDFVSLTIYYYFQVYGTKQYEFLADAIAGFLGFRCCYLCFNCSLYGFTDKENKEKNGLDKSGHEQI